MFDNIAVIIPVLEKNRYSEEGDLVKFGDVSLFEWKITQMKKIISEQSIFVSTPSEKIARIAKNHGIKVIIRDINDDVQKVIGRCLESIQEAVLLYTNVTSPFISEDEYRKMIKRFFEVEKSYDSLISVFEMRDFFIFEEKGVNFDVSSLPISRKEIEPLLKITNGCYISRRETCAKEHKYYGSKPYYYSLNHLASLEINEVDDLTIANDLLSLFFKRELISENNRAS